MESYRTVKSEGQDEFIERRSRFIGTVRPVTTVEEATAFLDEMRAKYWDATHNVYAYILRDGQMKRYSDDGEPQGTAGVPVLDVLQKENLTDLAVVVTRYFGGVLLGAGGLVRAYSHGAKLGVLAGGIQVMRLCVTGTITCDYNQYGRVATLVPQLGGRVEDTQFGMVVVLTFSLPKGAAERLQKQLADLTCGSVTPAFSGECFLPDPGKEGAGELEEASVKKRG